MQKAGTSQDYKDGYLEGTFDGRCGHSPKRLLMSQTKRFNAGYYDGYRDNIRFGRGTTDDSQHELPSY